MVKTHENVRKTENQRHTAFFWYRSRSKTPITFREPSIWKSRLHFFKHPVRFIVFCCYFFPFFVNLCKIARGSRKFGVGIFKSMVLETYWEFSNETGTKRKLCVSGFRFYERFRVFRPLNNKLLTKYVLTLRQDGDKFPHDPNVGKSDGFRVPKPSIGVSAAHTDSNELAQLFPPASSHPKLM